MKKQDISVEIQKICNKYAETHTIPQTELEWKEAVRSIGTQLPNQLETNSFKLVQKTESISNPDGSTTTIPKFVQEPKLESYDAFSCRNLEQIRKDLQTAYIEQPIPKIQIPERPNIQKFIAALKVVFPNVRDVKRTTKSIIEWRAAFTSKLIQKCLYLHSPKSGGTGKTFTMGLFRDYIESIGGKTSITTDFKSEFLNPNEFRANFTVIEDLRTPAIEMELLNNLIDRHEMSYNIKFGPKGTFTNSAMLAITSNYRPQNVNTRRWAEIEYFSYNMEDRSFDYDILREAVKDVFECVPDIKWLHANKHVLKSTLPESYNYEVLRFIADHGPTAETCRPAAFFAGESKIMVDQCKNMFIDWQSNHIFPTKWAATKFELKKFDWQRIAQFIEEQHMLDELDDDEDPLEQCAKQWDKLAAQLAACESEPKPTTPEPPTPEPPTTSTYKKYVDEHLQHFSDPSHETDAITAPLVTNCVRIDGSKARLHDKSDDVRPVVMSFESDTMSLADQENNIKQPIWHAKVFSGNKSIHVQVLIPDNISQKIASEKEVDPTTLYHKVYEHVAGMLFKDTSKLDFQCKSWIRKFRNPDGLRIKSDGSDVIQAAEYNTNPAPIDWESIISWCKDIVKFNNKELKAQSLRQNWNGEPRDVSGSSKVRRYLDTPFPKKNGNGHSDMFLYVAICKCLKFKDSATLEVVLEKAKSEKWTSSELQRKIASAKHFLSRRR